MYFIVRGGGGGGGPGDNPLCCCVPIPLPQTPTAIHRFSICFTLHPKDLYGAVREVMMQSKLALLGLGLGLG